MIEDDFRQRPMSREVFEALLIEVIRGANLSLVDFATEQVTQGVKNDEKIADVRAVWHAAEIALGILKPGYAPKREALEDARRMLAWIFEGDKTWLSTD